MPLVPVPTAEETRANRVFESLLWALSRPGLPRALPQAGAAQIAEALLDRECRVYVGDPVLMPAVMRTGADIAEVTQADHVICGRLPDAGILSELRQGSDLYPDDGATLVLAASFGAGERLRLSGPGIDGSVETAIAGLPEGFWQSRAQVMRYPMGFEMLLLDGAQVIGVPRSTHVEVL